MRPVTASSEPGLRAELRALEAVYVGWHLFISDEGRIWAVTVHYRYAGGAGYTVDAGTPEQIGHQIAAAEHEIALAA